MHLTAQQHATYKFIQQYIANNDIAPTETEIAAAIGIKSRGVVHRYLKALEKVELIEIIPNRKRNIKLVHLSKQEFSLPILGRIAAGSPIEAINGSNNSINLADYFAGDNRFILEVKGDSMIGDNIRNGDYIICEPSTKFSQSDINVVLIEGEDVTLKRCKVNENDTITLLASNPEVEPLIYPLSQVQIQGRYVGLLRLN